jgi:Tol biopolymer transport system component
MKDDGSNVQWLANTESRATEPRWSPDGKKIYFTNCKHVDWEQRLPDLRGKHCLFADSMN